MIYKDGNESFENVSLYVDLLEILRKFVLRKDLKMFGNKKSFRKKVFIENQGSIINHWLLMVDQWKVNDLLLTFGELKKFLPYSNDKLLGSK